MTAKYSTSNIKIMFVQILSHAADKSKNNDDSPIDIDDRNDIISVINLNLLEPKEFA